MLTVREFQELLEKMSVKDKQFYIYRDAFQNWVISTDSGIFSGSTLQEAVEDLRYRGF